MGKNKLLPCPMCGGKAELKICRNVNAKLYYAQIHCENCKLNIIMNANVDYSAKDECIRLWNSRKQPIEHDGCKDCKHQNVSPEEYPCNECKHNFNDNYEFKHWGKEGTDE